MPRKPKYACGVCLKACQLSCVLCETCNTWFHFLCEDMTSSNFFELASNPLPYICQKCTENDNGSYNVKAGLNRMAQFLTDNAKMQHVARRERLLLRNHLLPQRTSVVYGKSALKECAASKHTVVRSPVQDKVGIVTTGDGNCLYNALSTAMYGSEDQALLIKLWTAITLVLQKSKVCKLFDSHCLQFVDWDYNSALHDILTPGKWSSSWHIVAASVALNHPVSSVYPRMNSRKEPAYKVLNTTIVPSDKNNVPICIHWTGRPKQPGRNWNPNHFIALVDTLETFQVIDLLNSSNEESQTTSKESLAQHVTHPSPIAKASTSNEQHVTHPTTITKASTSNEQHVTHPSPITNDVKSHTFPSVLQRTVLHLVEQNQQLSMSQRKDTMATILP